MYAWPDPVVIGGVTLILLKLRKPIEEDSESFMELRRKVTAALGGNAMSVAGGLCSTMMFAQKAAELVRINAMGSNGTINEGVFKAVTLNTHASLQRP